MGGRFSPVQRRGVVWLVVWYAPIPVLFGTFLNVLVCSLLFANRRGGAARNPPMSQATTRHAI